MALGPGRGRRDDVLGGAGVWFDRLTTNRGGSVTRVRGRRAGQRRRPHSASSGQALRKRARDAGMTGMCPLWQANVSSFEGHASSFWPDVSTFRPNVSTLAGHVSSCRRRALVGDRARKEGEKFPSASSGQAQGRSWRTLRTGDGE